MNKTSIGFMLLLTGVCVFAFNPIRNDARRISTIVKTKGGFVEGIRERSGILAFKGLPFAAPPLGPLRWVAPQPIPPWSGIRKCQVYGPSPMQAKPTPYRMWSKEFQIPAEPMSEDCLYLNLWTSAKLSTAKMPVLVWIYGGGFIGGGSATPLYDGEALARKGIVFVSFNYRLGIFGFFAHPDLTKESPQKVSGNYAIFDQIAALKWVRENIAAFGGDPENITIDGQSAGASAVNYLIASPLTKGLFIKAIAQSGADFLKDTPSSSDTLDADLQQGEQEGIRISEQLKTTSLSQLKNVPGEQLLQIKFREWVGPVIDGYLLPQSVSSIFRQHKENSISLISGWTEDEFLIGPLKSVTDFHTDMVNQFGIYAKQMMSYYPASNDSEAAISQLRVSRDVYFASQNFTFANIESSHGRRVYVYRFTRDVPGFGVNAQYGASGKYGAFHGGEEFYLFDNLKIANRLWQEPDYNLATIMSSYWVNFVKTGNPNEKGLPEGPVYESHSKNIMNLGDHSSAEALKDSAWLEFLSSILNPK